MMYVAEIIKVAEARSATSSTLANPLLTETAMKLDDLLVWTKGDYFVLFSLRAFVDIFR